MSTKHSIKNEVVQMIFFVFQIVIGSMMFHGCVALRAGPLDVFGVMKVQVFFEAQMVIRWSV